MISTRLTTIDQGILSNTSIPAILKPLIERRTNNKRIFGKLEIIAPQIEDVAPATNTDAATPPRNIIAGFLLDTSGSMQGRKIQHAINTIKQLAEILLSERYGKTIPTQPIHSWIYVITFNSDAELVIPFQEITADTLPNILTQLDQIRTMGCTNYERAFKKQTEVTADVFKQLGIPRGVRPPTAVAMLDKPVGGASPPTGGSYHLIRFFGTDGEITEGTRSTEILYKMMRDTDAVGGLAPPTGLSNEVPAVSWRPPLLTFEDYVLGYGTEVDLNCLKTLASPYQRSEYRTHANRKRQYTDAYNCSSLITIVKPEDIGWQMGELFFKMIRRYGYKVQVSISAADTDATDATDQHSLSAVGGRTPPGLSNEVATLRSHRSAFAEQDPPLGGGTPPQLFEYQSHSWSNSTTLHSIIHGETKPLYIQYTPPDAATATVLVKVQYSNQFTDSTYTYEFEHTIIPSAATDPATDTDVSVPDLPISPRTPPGLSNEVPRRWGAVPPPILGMIQIEIFKQFREIEAGGAGGSKYDKDTIVREAYKTLRMLKSLNSSEPAVVGGRDPLITDVKVIIGLTTIQDKKETDMVLHARRICSGEQDIFNTGANISRKYVDGEEEHEEEATRVINAFHHDAAAAAAPDDDDNDAILSRITTAVIDTPYSQDPSAGYGGRHRDRHDDGSSELRTLCARIAMAKKNKEDFTTEQLYEQVRRYGICAGYHQHHHHAAAAHDDDDDQFSSTPMDNEYTQRRMGMMRQMSSQSPSH
jgi:hypothetical protein